MVKIGITGGIGTGKSVVSELLRNMGYPVFDTDREAKFLMEHSLIVRRKLIEAFGEEAYRGNKLNRAFLASLIFKDENARRKINAIVHPEVRNYFLEWSMRQEQEVVFFESAILYESDFHRIADSIWVVSAPEETRIARTVARDGATSEQVMARMQSQLPQEEKEKRADIVIQNDGRTALIPQVIAALQKMRDI